MTKKTKKKPLTKKQKLAVAIAKDALKQFTNNVYTAEEGVIINLPSLDDLLTKKYGAGTDEKVELQPFIRKALKTGGQCDVCIRGGLLLSTIVKDDKFKSPLINDQKYDDSIGEDVDSITPRWANFIGSYDPTGNVDKRLLKIFSEETLALAERVFEGAHNDDYLEQSEQQAADNWHGEFSDDTERAISILKNIIANKGKLVIPEEYYEEDYYND